MADSLLRAFRFQVKLRQSAGGAAASSRLLGVGLGVGGPFGAAASASFSASAPAARRAAPAWPTAPFRNARGSRSTSTSRNTRRAAATTGWCARSAAPSTRTSFLKRGNVLRRRRPGQRRSLWKWLQGIAAGERPVRRYDGAIEVMSVGDQVVATWTFDRGLPAKVKGPELNAKSGELAIEELHIAHEGPAPARRVEER